MCCSHTLRLHTGAIWGTNGWATSCGSRLYTSDKFDTSLLKGQLMDVRQRHAQAAYYAVQHAQFQHDSHQLFQEEKAFWQRTSDELGGIHRRHIELLRQQQLVQHEHQQLLQQLLKLENGLCKDILTLANKVVMTAAFGS